MISGVYLTPLRVIGDQRGAVMHMLRADDPTFSGFGEMYFSTVNAKTRKDWRFHRHHTSQLAVPIGTIHFVLASETDRDRDGSTVMEVEIGETNYQLLTIPPGVWYAFENRETGRAIIGNCSSGVHDPSEVERRGLDDPPVPYVWRS